MNAIDTDFINCTPHTLVLARADGVDDLALLPSGEVARVAMRASPRGTVNGFNVLHDVWGAVEGLPAPRPGCVFLVSGLVLAALEKEGSRRTDVLAPATGPRDGAVRDAKGFVIAVTQLKGL